MRYEVTYRIFNEPRTDTFLGSYSTTMDGLKTIVEATGPNQAQAIVEAQNGGSRFCRALYAYPVNS